MAEYSHSAEAAFLASLQHGGGSSTTPNNSAQPTRSQGAPDDEDDDYDPTNFVTEEQPAAVTVTQTTGISNLVQNVQHSSVLPSPTCNAPHPTQSTNSSAPVAGQNGTAARKPRTIGGFAVDDEDDEESSIPQSSAVGFGESMHIDQGTTSTPQRSVTQTPNNTFPPFSDSAMQKAAQTTSGNAVAHLQSTDIARVDSTDPPLRGLPVPASVNAGALANPDSPEARSSLLPKPRLPQDRIGILEDRISEDPRGDVDAWLSLISEHQKRNKLDEARAVYERFFKVFPQAGEQWVAYVKMELDQDELQRVEQIFNRSLMNVPSVPLWSLYLDYVRRRHNLATDSTGKARAIIIQAFEVCLKQVGIDKDAGFIWQDFINFIKSGPGTVGGSTWQDQQKMDSLRKTYKQAVCVPTQVINNIWADYGKFENELNKTTARKFLGEKMSSFMTAKQAYVELSTKTRGLDRTTVPRLPPAPGYDGDIEYLDQVNIWKAWIEWEKDDPLALRDEDPEAYRNRILYVFKHALMALRFWPPMWYDAAEFCFTNGMDKEGDRFLSDGMEANPESCLLAFQKADRLELSTANDPTGTDPAKRGTAVRAPYNSVLDSLYSLRKKVESRGERTIAQIEETFAQTVAADDSKSAEDEEDEDMDGTQANSRQAAKEAQVKEAKAKTIAQIDDIKKAISWTWIALMRAMRRIQGKGKAGEAAGGLRQIFADARKRGQLTGDLFVECGLMEYHCYREPAGTKILEKAVKLYPDDETVALAYIKHLIDLNDMPNARAVFETVVSRFSQDPEKVHKAKPLYVFLHDWESRYGELGQITKLEKRMADLFAKDNVSSLFADRFKAGNATDNKFDATSVRLVISPNAQLRPKSVPVIREISAVPQSPGQASVQSHDTPKRRFDQVDSDNELHPPRKVARGESPLKGAAGRRLEARRAPVGPTPLPSGIHFLLQILPSRAASQKLPAINVPGLLDILRKTDLKKAQIPTSQPSNQAPSHVGPPIPPPSLARPNFPATNMPPAAYTAYGMPTANLPPPTGGPMAYQYPSPSGIPSHGPPPGPPGAYSGYPPQWSR